jgi:hypothetical protein
MTHEQAPAWRGPGGRHRDGPGAFPSEQHLPPPAPSTAVLGDLSQMGTIIPNLNQTRAASS